MNDHKAAYLPMTAHKGWTAGAGATITTLVTLLQTFSPFLPEDWTPAVTGILGFLTAIAVYFVPNKPK